MVSFRWTVKLGSKSTVWSVRPPLFHSNYCVIHTRTARSKPTSNFSQQTFSSEYYLLLYYLLLVSCGRETAWGLWRWVQWNLLRKVRTVRMFVVEATVQSWTEQLQCATPASVLNMNHPYFPVLPLTTIGLADKIPFTHIFPRKAPSTDAIGPPRHRLDWTGLGGSKSHLMCTK